MPHSSAVIEVLKRELKARGITYAEVARAVGLSEASIKRLFSRGGFTLERIDRICAAAGIEFTDRTRDFDRERHPIARLTEAQEREIVDDPKLFLVAVCALNLLTYEDILAVYDLQPAELVALLLRLDKMEIVELLPNNRFKLRIARTFAWIPDGPIQTAFKTNAQDFFDSRFAADNELMIPINAGCRVSPSWRCWKSCAAWRGSSPPSTWKTLRCRPRSARRCRCCSPAGRGTRSSCGRWCGARSPICRRGGSVAEAHGRRR